MWCDAFRLGLAYAGSNREDVLSLLLPVMGDSKSSMEVWMSSLKHWSHSKKHTRKCCSTRRVESTGGWSDGVGMRYDRSGIL